MRHDFANLLVVFVNLCPLLWVSRIVEIYQLFLVRSNSIVCVCKNFTPYLDPMLRMLELAGFGDDLAIGTKEFCFVSFKLASKLATALTNPGSAICSCL